MKKTIILITAAFLILCGVSIVYAQAGKTTQSAETQVTATKAPSVFGQPQKPGTKATCPVLGNEFTIDKNTKHSEYKGRHVYFCCAGCKPDFEKNPGKYMKNARPSK